MESSTREGRIRKRKSESKRTRTFSKSKGKARELFVVSDRSQEGMHEFFSESKAQVRKSCSEGAGSCIKFPELQIHCKREWHFQSMM